MSAAGKSFLPPFMMRRIDVNVMIHRFASSSTRRPTQYSSHSRRRRFNYNARPTRRRNADSGDFSGTAASAVEEFNKTNHPTLIVSDDNSTNVPDDVRVLPTQVVAAAMPISYQEMDNTALTTLGAMGNHVALEEMLKRHIMSTDKVSYEKACKVFLQIEEKNHESEVVMAMPFQIGITACFAATALSIPLVFHLPTVEYFNEHFVTAEHPPLKELETALEVGSWSWNWMEPVMGTATFLLLSLQYMRMHLQQLGVTPYTHHMKRFRGKRLADAFPQYNRSLLFAYSESSPMYNPKDLWISPIVEEQKPPS